MDTPRRRLRQRLKQEVSERRRLVLALLSNNRLCHAWLYRDITSKASADLDNVDIQTVRAVLTYHFWSGGGYGG